MWGWCWRKPARRRVTGRGQVRVAHPASHGGSDFAPLAVGEADGGRRETGPAGCGWQRPQAGKRSGRRTIAAPQRRRSSVTPGLVPRCLLQHRTGQQQAASRRRGSRTGWRRPSRRPTGLVPRTHPPAGRCHALSHQDGDRASALDGKSSGKPRGGSPSARSSDFQSASAFVWWRGRYQDAVPPPPGISIWRSQPERLRRLQPATRRNCTCCCRAGPSVDATCCSSVKTIDPPARWGAGGRSRSEGVFRDQQRDPAPIA